MKKLIFAFVCCSAVGLTMTATPALVDDGNKASGDRSVVMVQLQEEQPVTAGQQAPSRFKHEWKVKKIDVTSNDGPKRIPSKFDGKKIVVREETIQLKRGDHPLPPPRGLNPLGGDRSGFLELLSKYNGGINETESSGIVRPTESSF